MDGDGSSLDNQYSLSTNQSRYKTCRRWLSAMVAGMTLNPLPVSVTFEICVSESSCPRLPPNDTPRSGC